MERTKESALKKTVKTHVFERHTTSSGQRVSIYTYVIVMVYMIYMRTVGLRVCGT